MKIDESKISISIEGILREAAERVSIKMAESVLLTQQESMRQFNLGRSDMAKIAKTFLSGREKPLYSVASINAYIRSQTEFRDRSMA